MPGLRYPTPRRTVRVAVPLDDRDLREMLGKHSGGKQSGDSGAQHDGVPARVHSVTGSERIPRWIRLGWYSIESVANASFGASLSNRPIACSASIRASGAPTQ